MNKLKVFTRCVSDLEFWLLHVVLGVLLSRGFLGLGAGGGSNLVRNSIPYATQSIISLILFLNLVALAFMLTSVNYFIMKSEFSSIVHISLTSATNQ